MAFVEELSFSFPAQGNDPLCASPGCNIRKMCSAYMANATLAKDPLQRLAAYARVMLGAGSQCMRVPTAEENIAPLLNTTLTGGTMRIWTYQTCTEYGFYQTCDPGSGCIFTTSPHLNTLQSYLDQCKAA